MTAQQRLAQLAGLSSARGSRAARTPFVLLVVLLLGAGMLTLLLLNASVNQGSFELAELKRQTEELTDEQQALQAEVDAFSAPSALADRAGELGLVPGGPPAFLAPDGSVLGDAEPAPAPSKDQGEGLLDDARELSEEASEAGADDTAEETPGGPPRVSPPDSADGAGEGAVSPDDSGFLAEPLDEEDRQ